MAAAVKDSEMDALAKISTKVIAPKATAPKPPSLPKSASGLANVGIAGTL